MSFERWMKLLREILEEPEEDEKRTKGASYAQPFTSKKEASEIE